MKLHDLQPAPGSHRRPVRVGRGRSGRRGKTAGRGTKGAQARGQIPAAYEGGQMPLHMRLPKLPGFRNPNKVVFNVVNLDTIDQFDAGTTVDPEALRSKGLIRKKGPVKVLGQGDISKAVTIRAHAFSQTAVTKIEAAGGTTEVL
ncbi:MAG TPA: 50S ribosomal protein L15 [Actinomycetota bacterium]|nr:50S ribosomal protein L15 [Actinomycetota bacterium]